MKNSPLSRYALIFVLVSLTSGLLWADGPAIPQPVGRVPTVDASGRFWVYRNGPAQPPMPFSPYGWMSDASNLTEIIHVDLKCRDHPNTTLNASPVPERDYCIQMVVTWDLATWASVAFISGTDKPPWWGDSNHGTYYDLRNLAKKRLVFYGRGEHGGETIKAQIGALGDKPYGDSLSKPITSEEIKLTPDWIRYEIGLGDVPPGELKAICNGFGVVVERSSQPGTPNETRFYIDDVYFE